LRILNGEVLLCFKKLVKDFNDKEIEVPDNELFQAFAVNHLLEEKVARLISYHGFDLNKEYAPHLFLLRLLDIPPSSGWIVESQRERGDGRPDLTIINEEKKLAIIIELKYGKAEDTSTLDSLVSAAFDQIERERYAYTFVNSYGF